MKTNTYDIVIIGSGLGGLVSAVLLAMEGYKVIVLEKNNQFGGSLQTFSRNKKIFDTGVHYIGGLAPNQNLYRYFDYLGIMKDLKIVRMPDVFDSIQIGSEGIPYPMAQGYAKFVEVLEPYFPDERKVIQQFLFDLEKVCSLFPLYNLEDKEYTFDPLLSLSLSDYFETLPISHKLKCMLLGNNFLYAGEIDKTPFYVYALIVNSYIQSSFKCLNGGGQIAKLLVKRIRSLGGEAIRKQEVVKYNITNAEVQSVETRDGNVYKGNFFISNVDPIVTLNQIGSSYFRKVYYDRVVNLPLTVSSFSVYIVLLPKKIPYMANNLYFHKDESTTLSFSGFDKDNWGSAYMLSMTEDKQYPGYADTITFLTAMHYDDFKPWHDTMNTISYGQLRGEQYETFKNKYNALAIDKIQLHWANIKESIAHVYSSSPLSYRDYIGTTNGSLYGPQKNAKDSLVTSLSSKTKMTNLFFTGQSVGMHGVLGVTIGAVNTCSNILGQSYLINKINQNKHE